MDTQPQRGSSILAQATAHVRQRPWPTMGWTLVAAFAFLGTGAGQLSLIGLALFAAVALPLSFAASFLLNAIDRRDQSRAAKRLRK